MADIDFAAAHCRQQDRLFLCDGDALIISQDRLLNILSAIRTKLPWVTRIGTYANTKSIKRKSPEQLRELRENGLQIAYMGLESGDDVTLQNINKGADAARRDVAIKELTVMAQFTSCDLKIMNDKSDGTGNNCINSIT